MNAWTIDADVEARVRLGEKIECPHGCGQPLRAWGARDGSGKPSVVSCGIAICIDARFKDTRIRKEAEARRKEIAAHEKTEPPFRFDVGDSEE